MAHLKWMAMATLAASAALSLCAGRAQGQWCGPNGCGSAGPTPPQYSNVYNSYYQGMNWYGASRSGLQIGPALPSWPSYPALPYPVALVQPLSGGCAACAATELPGPAAPWAYQPYAPAPRSYCPSCPLAAPYYYPVRQRVRTAYYR